MGFLLPASLVLLALAIPIIIFYMLRLRREERRIPSSMLWRRAVQDRTANAPWQRLRRNLLLLLQLLLLLLLVAALARPFVNRPVAVEGNLVIVLDTSASMQARDEAGGESRFDRAKREAQALLDGLGPQGRAALIPAGPSQGAGSQLSGDKEALGRAIGALAVSNGRAEMGQALTLAGVTARQLGDATVVLISDGAFSAEELPPIEAAVRYLSVGNRSANLGITALSLRESPTGPHLFAAIYNSGPEEAGALFTLLADDELRDSRRVSLGPGEEQTLTIEDLPLDVESVEVRLTADLPATDLMEADNRAWSLRPRPPTGNILLVAENNGFLEKALSLVSGVRLFKTTPAQYAPSDGFAFTVLDANLPADLPGGNLLLFAPPDSPLVAVSGTLEYPQIGPVAVNDPLLRFVDLRGVHIASARRMLMPAWGRALARTTEGDPLIVAGETGGRRVIVVAFDLHHTDLPLQVAFPILIANFAAWLRPQSTVETPPLLGPGDPITIRPLPEADEIVITPPGGDRAATVLKPSERLSFAGTDRLGVYMVQQRARGEPVGEMERFVVNLFSREESNITPTDALAIAGRGVEPLAAGRGRAAGEAPLEIWPWLLALGLGVLAVEWWVYNRPPGLRSMLARPRQAK